MKHIKLFEWFLKKDVKEDIGRTPQERALADKVRQEESPLNNEFASIKLNDKSVKKVHRGNTEIISKILYNFPHNRDLLTSIKYLQGISKKRVSDLFDFAFRKINYRQIYPKDYSVVMMPQSGSVLLEEFWQNLVLDVEATETSKGGSSWNPIIFQNAFIKRKWKDVEWDYEAIDRISNEKTKTQVLKLIERLSTKEGERKATLSSSGVHTLYRKFIKRFMDINPEILSKVESSVPGRGVILLDDSITDGTTKRQMIDLVLEYNPSKILFMAVFKNVGDPGS